MGTGYGWTCNICSSIFLRSGAKNAMEDSQQAENPDWKGALIPIVMVVLFVIVLISLVRS